MFKNILIKIAQELKEDVSLNESARKSLLAGLSTLLETFNPRKISTGTNKELKTILQFHEQIPTIGELKTKIEDCFNKVKNATTESELNSAFQNDLHQLANFCLNFKEEDQKLKLQQDIFNLLLQQKLSNKKKISPKDLEKTKLTLVTESYTLSAAAAYDMITWFLKDLERTMLVFAKSVGTTYEPATDTFKKEDASREGYSKENSNKISGFLTKYGKHLGLRGSVDGLMQLGLVFQENPNLYGKILKFINYVLAGIKTNRKLLKVREYADGIILRLSQMKNKFPEYMKLESPEGEFTYTVSDLEIREDRITRQDEIFIRHLKESLKKDDLVPEEEMVNTIDRLINLIPNTELSESNKSSALSELDKLKGTVNTAIDTIQRLEASFRQKGSLGNEIEITQRINKLKEMTTSRYKRVVIPIVDKMVYAIMDQLAENLAELEKTAIRKELGLIR